MNIDNNDNKSARRALGKAAADPSPAAATSVPAVEIAELPSSGEDSTALAKPHLGDMVRRFRRGRWTLTKAWR